MVEVDTARAPEWWNRPTIQPTEAELGMKWAKFWTYVSLPIGSVLAVLVALALFGSAITTDTDLLAVFGMLLLVLGAYQGWVVWGMHKRFAWAWQHNWVLVAACAFGSGGTESGASAVGIMLMTGVVALLIWIWPNHVYWKKRKHLYSNGQKTKDEFVIGAGVAVIASIFWMGTQG